MVEYGKKTVTELQQILKVRSIPHTGKKAELVARLQQADKADETERTSKASPPVTSTSVPNASAPSAEKDAPAVEPVAADEPPLVSPPPADTTAPLEPPQTTHPEREGSTATDAKLADAVNYGIGLNQSSYEDEVKKRRARAERFGAPAEEVDVEAQKAADRIKRFGTGGAANGGVGRLDEALPSERGRGKRGRDGAADDPGLKQGRGEKRRFQRGGRRNDNQGKRPSGVQKPVGKAKGVFSNERDRLAAEARKKKFATA